MKKQIIVFLTATVSLMLMRLWWLLVVLILITLIYRLKYSNYRFILFFKENKAISSVLIISKLVFFYIFIRLFIVDIYLVPSSSMEDTIHPGDRLIVNKLPYGPKIPSSIYEIPIVNIIYFLCQRSKVPQNTFQLTSKRLSGYGEYNKGDVMVFVHPLRKKTYIKRCIALPGDTLNIFEGKVFINFKLYREPPYVKHWYLLEFNNQKMLNRHLDLLETEIRYSNNKSAIEVLLNIKEANIISNFPEVDKITILSKPPGTLPRTFPDNQEVSELMWSEDYFGPLIIPYQGLTIPLDEYHFNIYANVINQYEGLENKLISKGSIFLLENVMIKSYTFKKNYFFMMGDNRHDSNDSKYWGPIPEEGIIGKASTVLFSKNNFGFDWSRTFKKLD